MRSPALKSSVSRAPKLYDTWFLFALIPIVILGLLLMTSASIVVSESHLRQPFYFLYKQMVFLFLGILIGGFILQVEVSYWRQYGGYLLLTVLLMLALVLFPGIGRSANGSLRWIGYGPWTFQVSELAKFVMVVYLAGYLERRNDEIQLKFRGFAKPLLILITMAVLLLKEPDFGATFVITTTALGMMFLAGMRLKHFVILFLFSLICLIIVAISEPYRIIRLTSFLNPWQRPFDSGYQLTQSLIAFGRGGWFGVGLGNSIQKMFYLPEAHTDFLFAVIAEELGLFGLILILALFTLLIIRMFLIGKRSQSLNLHFSGFLAYGFALWFSIQFLVSIGVNTGLLPTKGLTLPLMSYGGSSLLVNCICIALLLRIDLENRLKMIGIY